MKKGTTLFAAEPFQAGLNTCGRSDNQGRTGGKPARRVNHMCEPTLTLDEMKALGMTPFDRAEVEISMKKRIVRLVVIGKDGKNPTMNFSIPGEQTFEEIAASVIAASVEAGLLRANGTYSTMDLDALAKTAN